MWTREKTESAVKGAVIAAAGGALSALVVYAGNLDLGLWGPALVAMLSAGVNALRLLTAPVPDVPAEDVPTDTEAK